jgi:translocation and assembly module TamB
VDFATIHEPILISMQTEEKTPARKPDYVRKTARVLIKVILFLLLFIVIIFFLVLTPPVQRFATSKVETYLQKKLQTRVEIGSISVGLTGRVNLNNIYVEDQTKDTLISGGNIKANITLSKLLANEVEVKEISMDHITAKIKRILPDTVFNFKFIVDAFAIEKTKNPDTAATAPLKLDVYKLEATNSYFAYKDVITGNDMTMSLGNLSARMDTLDIYQSIFSVPSLDLSDVNIRFNQTTPLIKPNPVSVDMAQAAQPITMKLDFGTMNLKRVKIDYNNDVSSFYTNLNIGELSTEGEYFNLQEQVIRLKKLELNSTYAFLGTANRQQVEAIAKQAGQEIKAQAEQKNWDIRIGEVQLNNNKIKYDDSTRAATKYGLDPAHIDADSLTLHIQNLVFNTDSMGGQITEGFVREKSGFRLDELKADILYGPTQTYIKDFLVKTPGSELKRDVLLTYSSKKALTDSFQNTQMEIDIPDSYVQVKDILVFAPQLRSQPALSNPNDVWRMNINATGNMNSLRISALQFDGLKDTRIDAEGTLAGLVNPNTAGGTLVIRKLHTSQSDIALFTGSRLSTAQINLPETFDIHGTLSGYAARLRTDLVINSSAGGLRVNGSFANLTNPNAAGYNAAINTNGLRIGSILRNPQMGSLSGNFNLSGSGFTPQTMNTNFKGTVYSFGFNNYAYKNISLNGSLRKNNFSVAVDSKDPNAYLNLTASGDLSSNPLYKINGFVDSLKTLPLHLTTEPLVFRGKIDADIPSANPDYLEADILITKALFVSGNNRLPLDTLHLVSGRSDTGQYIRLNSDIANAQLAGKYRFADLGNIIQNNINPYFSITGSTAPKPVQPYNFSFTADVVYSPILGSFMPGLKDAQTIHAEGRLATGQGMQAAVTAPYILYGVNEISNLNLNVNTSDSGMHIRGTVARLKSGNSFDLYNTRLDATALNNNVNFNLRLGDQNDRDKYVLAGLIRQPSQGTIQLSLQPGGVLLNYEQWTVSPNNSITITPQQVLANNFILQKGTQQLALQSTGSGGIQPLNVTFTNFRLATITGFIKSDSLLVDGSMNGVVTFQNLLQQPVFTSNLTINDLSFKQDTVGNVALQVRNSGNTYITNATITGRGNDVSLSGSFTPQGTSDIALDLDLAIRQMDLSTFEGAMGSFVKSASGSVNGNVSINGTASAPKVLGTINFDNTALSTTLLGGPLTINDEQLNVTEKGFAFNNFTIRDSADNVLNLNGNITTSNFINYGFNLDVDARNFRALNTTKKDNKIYYGQLYLTSNLHIGGTETRPIVDGAVTVNEGTNFTIVIPQQEPGVVEREGVVVFTDFDSPENDSLFLAYDSLNLANVFGFDIATNIEIQKEAVFNIIVDAANGDFINVQGTGQLSAGIDPSGKITLTGSYEIDQGAYQFSYNFIQRRFVIEKGSKIVWLGEPTNAQVDVKAIYTTNTSPIDLLEQRLSDEQFAATRTRYLQKLPFQVHLTLTGELLKPTIAFDIILPPGSYNVGSDITTEVNARLAEIRQQPSELNKQVFAILLMNRFVGENPFQSSGEGFNAGSFARQSVSRLMTEQLNQLAAGLIEGVDINFDVASSDDYSTGERRSRTDLNVGLSKRLLNDRLTVTVGSNFELEGPQQTNQRSNNIAGNVNINYQLSKSGRYLLRFYRRNDYQGVVDGYIIETGLGITMVVDYNRIREILHAKKIRKEREARQAERQKREQEAQGLNQNPQQ